DHLTDAGELTMTRWVSDGLRLVSLAQAVCDQRGWNVAERVAVVRQDRIATFIFKKAPFTAADISRLRAVATRLRFEILYAPGIAARDNMPPNEEVDGTATGDYPGLIEAADHQRFYQTYRQDITPTTDDRPFFFHTTKLKDQFD